MNPSSSAPAQNTPIVTSMRVIPVAGEDSMLLNLSGAHAPFFTRNLIILTDSAGNVGVGEVPGGEKIRKVLEDSRPIVEGEQIGRYNRVLRSVHQTFAAHDTEGRGLQTFARLSTLSPRSKPQCSTSSASSLASL